MVYVLIINHAKFSYSSIESQLHVFFKKSNTFIGNTRLKLAKN